MKDFLIALISFLLGGGLWHLINKLYARYENSSLPDGSINIPLCDSELPSSDYADGRGNSGTPVSDELLKRRLKVAAAIGRNQKRSIFNEEEPSSYIPDTISQAFTEGELARTGSCGSDGPACFRGASQEPSGGLGQQEQRDPIVESVREKLLQRSRAGILKYGVMLNRNDLTVLEWMEHLQQELLDAANYLEVLIRTEEER